MFELCDEHVMASYVYNTMIRQIMSCDDIVVKLRHIGRHRSELTVIVTLNCVAKIGAGEPPLYED